MSKDAVLQVRMDPEVKKDVEALYLSMGTTFPEAVRIFAQQSLNVGGMPIPVTGKKKRSRGMLAKYADPSKWDQEEGAFERAMVKKYAKAD